jgi:hypothetical protein
LACDPRRVKWVGREKRLVLRRVLGGRIILTVGPFRGEPKHRKRIGGVLQDVTRWTVTIDTGGSLSRVAVRGIRTATDDHGSSLGEW